MDFGSKCILFSLPYVLSPLTPCPCFEPSGDRLTELAILSNFTLAMDICCFFVSLLDFLALIFRSSVVSVNLLTFLFNLIPVPL